MGETDTTEAAEVGHGGTDEQRLTAVENAVNRLADAVNHLLPGSHAEAQQRQEEHLDRPSDVASQARAAVEQALAERDKAAADAKTAEGKAAEEASVKERLARLEERPPAPPRLRRTKLLGWGDGRG